MSSQGTSDEEQIERNFLRLASAETAKQLEAFVLKYLVNCVELASSANENVKKQGLELLTHLNKRLKGNEDVQLPVEQILASFQSCQSGSLSSNFAMIYIKMGYSRLPKDEQLRLLPALLKSSKGKSRRQQNELFGISAPVFFELAGRKPTDWPKLELDKDPELRGQVLSFFVDILLLPPSGPAEFGNESPAAPAGMSKESFDRVRNLPTNKDDMKCRILQLIASNMFKETEALELAVIGMANSAHFVVSAAEAAWKKLDLQECLKDKQLVMKLFLLYSGTKNAKDVPLEQQQNPAGLQLRLKIFSALIRSQVAPLMFPKNIQVTFDALFGTEGTSLKLQLLATEFLGLIVTKCPDNFLPSFGPILFSGIRKIIETSEHARVVAMAYQSFGVIGKRCPHLVNKDMALVQESFDAIPTAPEEVASAIVDCLTTWLPVFSSMQDVATRKILQALIGTYVAHESPKCRLVSLKYIEALLSSSDVESRWMLCNAYGDSREDIRKEALRLLQLSLSVSSTVPSFALVVGLFADKLFSQGRTKISNDTWHICTRYAFACLTVQANRSPQLDLAADETYLEWLASVGQLLSRICVDDAELVSTFLRITLSALEAHPDAQLFDIATLTVSAAGEVGRLQMASRLEWVRDIAQSSSRQDLCSAAAQLLSVSLAAEQVSAQLADLHRQLTAIGKEQTVGAAWLCGFLTTRPECDRELIAVVQTSLVGFATSDRPSAFSEAACGALAESLRRNPNLLPDAAQFVDQLGKMAASRKESIKPKLKEAALAALGYSSRIDTTDDIFDRTLTALFAVGEGPPQAELQFNVGDALFDAIVGDCSPARRNVYTETADDFALRTAASHDLTCSRVSSALRVILDEKLTSANWHLRQAALIWLFVLMKRGGRWHPAIKASLDRLQEAFIDGLAETNDLSQDVASKGLGLVYEMGTAEQKQTMVTALVDSLTTGRKLKPRGVTDDTKIFEKGVLGNAPGGESLSTYRELCALATDLNQPDLMYKFMQLANHNALWNSKKGAAFGFSVVLDQAKEQLEPHLGSLVPKLFRYRYDPDQKVQSSMRAIWQALAGSRRGVIDEFADKIFAELVPSLTNAQWRVRESGCLALSDLLSGHGTPLMIDQLGDLFERLFRVQDDVKESVRVAATRCMNTLINVTLRHCNSERGDKATATIGVVLPVLIEKGMKSVVKTNRMVSLGAVISLAKEAGAALKPHLAFLIPCLLESLSETEPTVLNYLAARSTGEQLEALDTARASAAKTSPMMTALYDCVPHVDATVMRELGPRLGELLRSSVGLSTRTGACQLLITVCLRCPRDLMECRPVCDKLLQSLSNGLKDRNVTIRKQYASAIGYLAKFSSNSLIEKLLSKVKNDYVNQEVDAEVAAGFLLRGLANNNLELLRDYAGEVVPLIMLTKNTDVPADGSGREMVEIWEEVWAELVPGSEGAVRLYRQEICSFALSILANSSVWSMKANAAKVLQSVAELGGKQMEPAVADELYDALIKALAGRTWDGKERVLMAIAQLLKSCGTQLKTSWDSSVIGQKFAPLLKECERPKLEYKAEALLCTAVFCEQLKYGEGADALIELIKPLLKNADPDSDSDSEKDKQKVADKLKERQRFETAVVDAIGYVAIGVDKETTMSAVFDLLMTVLESAYWKVKQTAVVSLRRIFEKWPLTKPYSVDTVFIATASVLFGATQTVLADDCVKTLQALIEKVVDGNPSLSSDNARIKQVVRELLSAEACQQSPTFCDALTRLRL